VGLQRMGKWVLNQVLPSTPPHQEASGWEYSENPFWCSAQWPVHPDTEGCSCRGKSPGINACTEGWGTCPQMTFGDTPHT
jgi:hypothetical protein